MFFFERCFVQTYHAFTRRYYAGRENVAWWLDQANDRGWLPLPALSDAALLAMARTARASSTLAELAVRELAGRATLVSLRGLGASVLTLERHDLDDWVLAAVLDRTEPDRRPLAWATVLALYLPKLADFLSRFFVIDLEDAAEAARGMMVETYSHWDDAAGRGFVPELLRRCFQSMPQWQPTTVPASPPAWFRDGTIENEELEFLRHSLSLSRTDRLMILSTIYMDATVVDLAASINVEGNRVAPATIDRMLSVDAKITSHFWWSVWSQGVVPVRQGFVAR
jgi:hypothetical protein